MLSEHQPLAAQRAALARAVRKAKTDPDSAAAVVELRADYAAARLEDFIRRTVATAPPLSQVQRERLAMLLRGGANDAV